MSCKYNVYHLNPTHAVAEFALAPTAYTVDEDDGPAVVIVEVTGGELTFDIEVDFETVLAGSTATGISQVL